MKHFLLAALAALSVTVQAQDFEHVTDIPLVGESGLSVLPGTFTQGGQAQFVVFNGDSYNTLTDACVYDMFLNKKKSFALSGGIIQFGYYDDRERLELGESMPIGITQTLFDDDDSYEWFSPIGDDKYNMTGLLLRKDDGTVITTIDFGNWGTGWYRENFRVFHCFDDSSLKGMWYLAIKLRDKDYNFITRFYSFEKGKISSTIKQVKDVHHGIKATPALPKANELVKVDLGGMKSPRTLSVVNASGAVVTRMQLEDGQQEANVSTHGLPAGMYVIRVSDGKTETDNCKIIIR